jgi:biotin operon repressor
MAAKTITMQQLRLIIQHLNNGLSSRMISKSLGMSRKTIAGYLEKLTLLAISYDRFFN